MGTGGADVAARIVSGGSSHANYSNTTVALRHSLAAPSGGQKAEIPIGLWD